MGASDSGATGVLIFNSNLTGLLPVCEALLSGRTSDLLVGVLHNSTINHKGFVWQFHSTFYHVIHCLGLSDSLTKQFLDPYSECVLLYGFVGTQYDLQTRIGLFDNILIFN